jgi:hypothetical protein
VLTVAATRWMPKAGITTLEEDEQTLNTAENLMLQNSCDHRLRNVDVSRLFLTENVSTKEDSACAEASTFRGPRDLGLADWSRPLNTRFPRFRSLKVRMGLRSAFGAQTERARQVPTPVIAEAKCSTPYAPEETRPGREATAHPPSIGNARRWIRGFHHTQRSRKAFM